MAIKKSAARLNAEREWYSLLDLLDPKGGNSKKYKELFSNMSETAFKNYMKDIRDDKDRILFQVNSMDDKDITTDKLFAKAKKLGVRTHKYISYEDDGVVTTHPILVIQVGVKRLQQMLDKKNAAVADTDKVNPLLGTVTSDSKAASMSDVQTFGLITTGQLTTLKEMLGPRADDEPAKRQMISQIEGNGQFRLDDIVTDYRQKQSMNTMRTMLLSAGLEITVE